MNCLDCQEQLQRRLDGDTAATSGELERHLGVCSSCREQYAAAGRLLEALKDLTWPTSSSQLTPRIVAAVLQDRRLRQRRLRVRWLVTTALAASILVMALAGYFLLPIPKNPGPEPGPKVVEKGDHIDAEPPPEIAKSMDDARDAVVSLTGRLADQTTQQAKMLLAAANPMEAAPIVNVPAPPDAIDAAQTLRQAGQGLSEGLEPVTRSTRRAVQFFVREVAAFDTGGQ